MKIVWSENLDALLNSWEKNLSDESVSLQIWYSISKVKQYKTTSFGCSFLKPFNASLLLVGLFFCLTLYM